MQPAALHCGGLGHRIGGELYKFNPVDPQLERRPVSNLEPMEEVVVCVRAHTCVLK
jgi:hypothetical protein